LLAPVLGYFTLVRPKAPFFLHPIAFQAEVFPPPFFFFSRVPCQKFNTTSFFFLFSNIGFRRGSEHLSSALLLAPEPKDGSFCNSQSLTIGVSLPVVTRRFFYPPQICLRNIFHPFPPLYQKQRQVFLPFENEGSCSLLRCLAFF